MCSIWGEETTKAWPEAHKEMMSRLLFAAALAAALVWLPPGAKAGCARSVVLYNADWCPYCRQVRAILARNHIRYGIKDATTARVQAEMVRRFGDTAVPRLLIGGAVVEGVDEARIKQLCRK
jgi:glutaredoxin